MRKENRLLVLEDLIWYERKRLTSDFPKTFVNKGKVVNLRLAKLNQEIDGWFLSTYDKQKIYAEVMAYLNTNSSNPFQNIDNQQMRKIQRIDEKLKEVQKEVESIDWFIQKRYNHNSDTKRRQALKITLTKNTKKRLSYSIINLVYLKRETT
jgi:hypothetical protein